MQSVEFKGKKYIYYNDNWVDSNYICVPSNLVSQLNSLLFGNSYLEKMSCAQLVTMGDKYKNSKQFDDAIRTYMTAMKKATKSTGESILARITSCYRQIDQPQSAIDVCVKFSQKYDCRISNTTVLTSIAAAYCDIDDFIRAKKCADRACAILGGKSSPELAAVYKRIKLAP